MKARHAMTTEKPLLQLQGLSACWSSWGAISLASQLAPRGSGSRHYKALINVSYLTSQAAM